MMQAGVPGYVVEDGFQLRRTLFGSMRQAQSYCGPPPTEIGARKFYSSLTIIFHYMHFSSDGAFPGGSASR
jgi:hypothetical protein